MQELWHGFEKRTFTCCGRQAILVLPKKRNTRGDWALKTEYWDAFPNTEVELLNRGFHLLYLQNRTRFATPQECEEKAAFCEEMIQQNNLAAKGVFVGMSCGGAHALKLAELHPEKAGCLFLDAPVVSYMSYPGRYGDEECESVWEKEFVLAYPGIKRYQLLQFAEHPISRISVLIENRIPILMLYGTQDLSVPYAENGRLLEEAYSEVPELLSVQPRVLQGHHPHGMADPAPVADTIEQMLRKRL